MNPRKIVVVGVSASGKSTFARRLAIKTNLPLAHMDAVMWKPGWNYIGDEEVLKKLEEISSGDDWIIEGFINKNALNTVLGKADQIIYLDYSPHISAWRYIKRWIKHRKKPRPELEGSPEKFSFEFLRRVWERKEVYWLNRFIGTMANKEKILYFRSPKQASQYLER